MKNVTFKKITIANFLSIGKQITIPFNVGINIITGYNLDKEDGNGVGKSTVVDAFFFALFGETLRSLKKEEIINNIAKKNCKVTLEFEIDKNGTKSNYIIERGLAPSYCKIYVDTKEEKTLSTIPATNLYILNLINSTQAVFKNTITMGINTSVPFMSQKKNEKRQFIEGILRLELFSVMNKVSKEKHDEIFKEYDLTIKTHEENNKNILVYLERKESFEKNRTDKINYLIERKTQYERELAELQSALIQLDTTDYNSLLTELEKTAKDYQNKEIEYKNLTKTLTEAETSLRHTRSMYDEIIKKTKTLKTQYDDCIKTNNPTLTIDECKKVIAEAKEKNEAIQIKITDAQRDIKDCNTEIRQIKEVGTCCDKCKRPFPENDIKKNEERIQQLTDKIADTEKFLEIQHISKESNKNFIQETERAIQTLTILNNIKEQVIELSTQKTKYNEQVEILNKKIESTTILVKQQEQTCEDVKKYYQSLQLKKEELRVKIEKNNTTKKLIESNKNNILNCDQDINKIKTEKNQFEELIIIGNAKKVELEKKIDEYKEKVAVYDVIKFIVSDEGIKSFIIKKMLAVLNERINYYLTKMDANCKLTFNEYFEDNIINDRNIECSYQNFSAGERKRIDLACLFAFMDLRRIQGDATFNTIFYDELLDSALSKDGSEKVFNILQERLTKYNEIPYIITHRRENLKNPLITDIVYLEKLGGITRLGEFKK